MVCIYCYLRPPGFRKLALDCCIAAIQHSPPNPAAQGLITKLMSAIEPIEIGRKQEFVFPVIETLFEASSSGSWVATAELAKLDEARARIASNIHKKNGGYNTEYIDDKRNRVRFKSFSVENGYLNISHIDLRDAELATFVSLSPSQLCQDTVDLHQNTLAHLAAMLGRDDLLRHLLQTDPGLVNKQNKAGETPLYKACAAGQLTCIELLLEFHADPSILQTHLGISCLHWLFLIEEQHMSRIAGLLLQNGALVSSRTIGFNDSSGLTLETEHFPFHWPHGTPFHWACHVGSSAAAQVLLEHGAEVDEGDTLSGKETQRALDLAMMRADSTMVHFLLKNGANPHKRNRNGFNALHMLVVDKDNLNIVITRPLSTWGYLGSSENSLKEKKRCVELFKQYGGDLNAVSDGAERNTAIVYAAISGDSHGILALVEAGANADTTRAPSGESPLYIWLQIDPERLAYPSSYFSTLGTLIHSTKDLNTREGYYGNSLFHSVIYNSGGPTASSRIITWLHSNAPQCLRLMEARNKYHLTPFLMVAGDYSRDTKGTITLHNLLLELGANSTARDADGGDFVWWLTQNRAMPESLCLSLLQEHMANLSNRDKRDLLNKSRNTRNGTTALMNMVRCVYRSCVEYALQLGVDITFQDSQEQTALDIALDIANIERMELLRMWMDNMNERPMDLRPGDVKDFLFLEAAVRPEFGRFTHNP